MPAFILGYEEGDPVVDRELKNWCQIAKDDPSAARRGAFPRRPQEGKSLDPFVDAMCAGDRTQVPAQPSGKDNKKRVWNQGTKGEFVENPKPGQ